MIFCSVVGIKPFPEPITNVDGNIGHLMTYLGHTEFIMKPFNLHNAVNYKICADIGTSI